jgi:hypothetical protein
MDLAVPNNARVSPNESFHGRAFLDFFQKSCQDFSSRAYIQVKEKTKGGGANG